MTDQNFSQEEIDKFDGFAEDWWDPNGSMRPLHLLNPLRCDYVKQHTQLNGATLLDVGCGAGLFSEALAQDGAKVSAIDMSEGALKVAKEHAEKNKINISYVKSTAESYAQQYTAQADIVTCMEMIEHVPDPSAIVQACADAAKPGGVVFFSTINRTLKGYFQAILGAEYLLRLLPKGTHEYAKFIRPSELNKWAQNAGLELLDLTGVGYNPVTELFKFKSDVSVNYLCCYTKR
jgi:2-polyprenyl-6-hydroxyphenyl methylase/3-demethylubiquinone-9 3-methyltransferase